MQAEIKEITKYCLVKYELILWYRLKKIVDDNENFYNYDIKPDIWKEITRHEEYEKFKKFFKMDYENAKVKIFTER